MLARMLNRMRSLPALFGLLFTANCGSCGRLSEPTSARADGSASRTEPAASHAAATSATCKGRLPSANPWVSDRRLCVYVFADHVGPARQMAFAPNGDLFVNNGQVTVLWDADGDGASDARERATFATAPAILHGLAFAPDARFVYASSDTRVYRFAYSRGSRRSAARAQLVVRDMPAGGHGTRTLAFDSKGRLLVSVGSAGNVDAVQRQWDTRSQVRRFALPSVIPSAGLDYASGQVIASGMRNEVGLFVDARDRIWGVENGRDNLYDDQLGGDIHTDNPAEEINLIDDQGSHFYGYPFCWSEWKLAAGRGRGTQWADDSLSTGLRKSDAWCRDPANVRPPVSVMQAHWAPLGIVRYTGRALPFAGDLIITAHGSWNRIPATGRVIARAHVAGDTITRVEPIVGGADKNGQLQQGSWDARPVDVREGPDGALYVSDDAGGRVFRIGYTDR